MKVHYLSKEKSESKTTLNQNNHYIKDFSPINHISNLNQYNNLNNFNNASLTKNVLNYKNKVSVMKEINNLYSVKDKKINIGFNNPDKIHINHVPMQLDMETNENRYKNITNNKIKKVVNGDTSLFNKNNTYITNTTNNNQNNQNNQNDNIKPNPLGSTKIDISYNDHFRSKSRNKDTINDGTVTNNNNNNDIYEDRAIIPSNKNNLNNFTSNFIKQTVKKTNDNSKDKPVTPMTLHLQTNNTIGNNNDSNNVSHNKNNKKPSQQVGQEIFSMWNQNKSLKSRNENRNNLMKTNSKGFNSEGGNVNDHHDNHSNIQKKFNLTHIISTNQNSSQNNQSNKQIKNFKATSLKKRLLMDNTIKTQLMKKHEILKKNINIIKHNKKFSVDDSPSTKLDYSIHGNFNILLNYFYIYIFNFK